MSTFYINGTYLSEDSANISILDLGLLRGYGIFDYLRTYQRRPFHLKEHLQRLKFSADEIGLSVPHSLEEIESIVETLIEKTPGEEISIKILVTGGISPDQFTPQNNSSLIAYAFALKPFREACYTNGVHAATSTLPRSIPRAKTIHYIPALMAMKKAREVEASEALFLSSEKGILEGTTSNFFAIKGKTLITAHSDELLFGITREVIINLARGLFTLEFRTLPLSEIESIDECFLSSSNREVMPIISIDGMTIGSGQVGKHTRLLMQRFSDYTRKESWPLLRIPRHDDGQVLTEHTFALPVTADDLL